MIEPGLYLLMRDIVNPHPDRRKTDWRCQPIFTAGSEFALCRTFSDLGDDRDPGYQLSRRRGYSHQNFFVRASWIAGKESRSHAVAQFRALEPALVRLPLDSIERILDHADRVRHRSSNPLGVLLALERLGRLSLDDVRAAIENHNDHERQEFGGKEPAAPGEPDVLRFGFEGLVDGQWDTLHIGEQNESNTFETREQAEAELPRLLRVMDETEAHVRVCELRLRGR